MKCPECRKEMQEGVVQSAGPIFFTTKEKKNWLFPNLAVKDEILLSSRNWVRPTCRAYCCANCRKVVLEYEEPKNREKGRAARKK